MASSRIHHFLVISSCRSFISNRSLLVCNNGHDFWWVWSKHNKTEFTWIIKLFIGKTHEHPPIANPTTSFLTPVYLSVHVHHCSPECSFDSPLRVEFWSAPCCRLTFLCWSLGWSQNMWQCGLWGKQWNRMKSQWINYESRFCSRQLLQLQQNCLPYISLHTSHIFQ